MNELELRQEFGIDEVEETAVEVVEEKPKTQPHLDTDFEYARENIYQGVEMQAEAMQDAMRGNDFVRCAHGHLCGPLSCSCVAFF